MKLSIVLSFWLLVVVASLPLAASQVNTSREDELLETALEYIEKNRKGAAQIRLIDDIRGRPVSAVEVRYQQTSHDFMFGTLFGILTGHDDLV
jgi:hypothetical protein